MVGFQLGVIRCELALLVGIATLLAHLTAGQNSFNGRFYNKFRHWPLGENGTCGDGGEGTVTCPPGYDCYVGPIYNRPYFCYHTTIDPNADPFEVMEKVRSSAMVEAMKITTPLVENLHQQLNGSQDALVQMAAEIQELREEVSRGKTILDWVLAVGPIVLLLLSVLVVLLFYLQQQNIYANIRQLFTLTTERIDNLAEACFNSTPPPPNMIVKRHGQPTNEVMIS
jgi:hypothetical protein